MLLDAFDSNWIAPLGPQVDTFERELADYVGVGHAAALSSGTAGLHLALILLGVEAGDEVLVATQTFAATANAVVYVGARPVFVDSDPGSWTIDPALVAEELDAASRRGRLPKAVIAVDLYGQSADYGPLLEACERHGVPLVEDAAEGLGATYRGRRLGGFGRVGVFSFNGNKIITTSGGGMLVSDDADLVRRARFLATQAREPAPHYEHRAIGFNYRLSNLLAALGRAQLAKLDERVRARLRIRARYREGLGDLPGLTFMPEPDWGTSNGWLTCVEIDPEAFGADREAVRLHLEAHDIESRPTWKPMHLQPVFAECRAVGGAASEAVFRRGLCLPSGSSLSEADQDRVIAAVREVAR